MTAVATLAVEPTPAVNRTMLTVSIMLATTSGTTTMAMSRKTVSAAPERMFEA